MTDGWEQDLSSIGPSDWTPERARHLLDRAGFGGPPEEIARLAAMPPEAAVAWFIDFKAIDDSNLPPFEHSGIYDPGLMPFPPTRVNVDQLLGVGFHPPMKSASARKHKRMGTVCVDDGQLQIAVEGRALYGLPIHR